MPRPGADPSLDDRALLVDVAMQQREAATYNMGLEGDVNEDWAGLGLGESDEEEEEDSEEDSEEVHSEVDEGEN